MTTAITHVVLADSDGAAFVGLAKARARELYAQLERAGRKFGSQRFEVGERGKTFYVEISVSAPHVRIYIDSKGCPSYASGLVWIKDYFEPTVTVDEVEYLRTLFPKATPTIQEDSAKLAGNGQQIRTVRSTMYSGEMRKVVQVLLGMDQPVDYDYHANRTHGVFRTGDGRRWVIEVSSGGVFAWPMNTCRGKNTPEPLGYTPLPSPRPEEPRELVSAEIMREVYSDKGGFYGSCGWAFSDNGSKFANCFVGSQDIYSYAWQYEISIATDDDGNPASGSVDVVAEGYIHGSKFTHMKYPRDYGLSLYSFDPYGGNANYVHACEAPVHCFYDGERLSTFFYVWDPNSSSYETVKTWGDNRWCTEYMGIPQYSGDYSEAEQPFIRFNSTAPLVRIGDARNEYIWDATEVGVGYEPIAQAFGDDHFYLTWEAIDRRVTGRYTRKNDGYNVLIVPPGEREAGYLVERIESSNLSYSNSEDRHFVWNRYWLHWKMIEDCDATSAWGNPVQALVTSIGGENWYGEECQTGIRMASLQPVWLYRGKGLGSTIEPFKQREGSWNGCQPRYSTGDAIYFDDYTVEHGSQPRIDYITYGASLYMSGGITHRFQVDDADAEQWIKFIQVGMNDQIVQVVRDAFQKNRFAYSRRVNEVAGYLLDSSNIAPYNLQLVKGATFAFVGEP